MRWEPRPRSAQQSDPNYWIWSAGVFPKEYSERQQREYEIESAKKYPRIPAWLGENPPLGTVFVPNGEILTYGPLGLHIKDPRGKYAEIHPEGEKWYRYTAEGELLGIYDVPSRHLYDHGDWRHIYADWQALEAMMRELGYPISRGSAGSGTTVVYVERGEMVLEEQTGYGHMPIKNIIAAYDYLGNPLDPDAPRPDEWGWHIGGQIPRELLTKAYAMQVELGLADPSEKSPWVGTERGPIAVDPTPRSPRRFARYEIFNHNAKPGEDHNLEFRRVEIKPLDDPANPYREQYGPWDHWLLENYGAQDPEMNERHQKEMEAQQAEIALAKKENRKPDFSKIQFGIPSNNPWQPYEVYVDENGYQLPHRQFDRKQGRDFREPLHYRPKVQFSYWSGGVMPEEMKRAIQEIRDAQHRASLPDIPAWLAAAPPYSVIFIPNGDFVTYGPLGSWVENWRELPKAQRAKAGGYYRFNANGELLGSSLGESPNWWSLYNPQYPSLELSGKSQGYDVEFYGGFLIWRRPKELGGEAVAAWDYDGTPLSIEKPLTRESGYLQLHNWEWLRGKAEESLARAN